MTMLRVIHDVHIGAARSAGTTPATQLSLRQHLLDGFSALIPHDQDLMILGDLFDTHNIPMQDVLKTFLILKDWLEKGQGNLYLVPGNHDLSRTSSTLSSFQFLCKLLESVAVVHIIDTPTMTEWGYIIPHVPNQDLFDLELSKVPACDTLYLHCNYDNNFAAQSDQSLNLSKEQAEALPVRQIILAHEHHARKSGKVIVPGNQVASSVSDWLQPGDKQFVTMSTIVNGELKALFTDCALKEQEFVEMPWDAATITNHKFVRLTGQVPSTDVNKVFNTFNKFRSLHPALVITNAVTTISEDKSEVFAQSLESVQAFSVWNAIEALVSPDEFKVCKEAAQKAGL